MAASLSLRWSALRPYQHVGLVAGPVVALAVLLLPSGLHRIGDYGHRPAAAAAVALWMAIWWFSEAVPMGVTACLPLVLFPALGVFGESRLENARAAAAPFVDAYIFLFLGGMAVGAAMEQWNLHRRVALHIMARIGTAPQRLLLGVLVATGAVSLWISNTATAVMMVPIGMALLAQLETARGERLAHFGTAVMLAVAYGANVGGIGTKIGTATNSIFAGWVATHLGQDVGFLRFMLVGLPFVVLFTPVMWWALWRVARRDATAQLQGRDVIERALRELGPMSGGERTVAAVFCAAAALWVLGDVLRPLVAPRVPSPWEGFRFSGKHYEAAVAMSAAVVLLLARRLSWGNLRRIPWTALLLLGGSFALAAGIEGSGLSGYLTAQLAGLAGLPLLAQLGLAAGSTILLSAFASNTASVNLMLNVLPRSLPVLTVATLAASCDFALPAGTPPNAIVFGSGYVRLPTMMRVGLLLDVLAAVLLALYGWTWVRLVLP